MESTRLFGFFRLAAVIGAIAVIFLLDCVTPQGYAPWILYVLPLYLSRNVSFPVSPVRLMAACTLLIIAAGIIKQPHTSLGIAVFNRSIWIVAGWVIALLITRSARVEAQLRGKEETLSTLFRSIPVGIGMVRERRFQLVNESLTRLTGYSKGELEGKSTRMIYDRESDYENAGKLYARFQTTDAVSYDSKLRRKDGKILDVHVVLAPVNHGNPAAGVVFSMVDITELRKAQEDLERQKRTFEALTEYSPNVVFILDKNMRYTYINSTAEKMTGISRAQFIGKTAREIGLPEKSLFIWEACFKMAVEQRKPCFMESDYPSEAGMRYFINANVPLFAVDGSVENVLGFSHDITDLKNTQKMLEKRAEESEESHRTLQALMDNISEGILVADAPNIEIKAVSKYAKETAAMPPDVVLGAQMQQHGMWELLNQNGAPLPLKQYPLIQAIRYGKVMENEEMTLRTRDGSLKTIIVNATPIRGRAGDITGGIAAWRDITSIKQAEEVLRRDRETFEQLVMERTKELVSAQIELEKVKRLSDIGELAATVAHELRNPLSVIRAAVFNIHRKCADHGVEHSFANIEKKIVQSDQIINNLLFYSRLKVPHLEKVELYHLLAETTDSYRKRFSDFKLEDQFQEIKGQAIDADPLQLGELFSNIINNAHDAVKDKQGVVRVEARRLDGRVVLEFEDNGCGMEREQLSRMFEPFYTTKSKGTGLGMSVSRQIVDLHKGQIKVISEKEKGTKVFVELPVKQQT